MDDLVLPLDAFIRSVGVNKATPHALFLGAGASISSGVPSANKCIWEWKRDIFLTNNPGLESQFSELSLPSVQRKIQRWLDAQGGYPLLGTPEEYSFYITNCYSISEDRRLYFQEKIKTATPHVGYKLLCSLAEMQIVRSVWTTNFDGLVGRAAAGFAVTPIEVGIDCQDRLPRQPRKGEILCVSLHGDYRYDKLKNTSEELKKQEEELQKHLITHVQDVPLVICGYSGRDQSIMEAFTAAYAQPGPGSLYWCGYDEAEVPEPVKILLEMARSHKRTAYFVRTYGFDDLMKRLAFHCLEGQQLERAKGVMSSGLPTPESERVPFELENLPTAGVIKSNAFPVICPSEVFEFEVRGCPEDKLWDWLDEKTQGYKLVAVPLRGKVLALGIIDDIKRAFGNSLAGRIERTPVTERDLRFENGQIISLLRRALIRSIALSKNLATDGKETLSAPKPYTKRNLAGQDCLVYESAVCFLRQVGGGLHFIVKPSVQVTDGKGNKLPKEKENEAKLSLLGWQHNKEFNEALDRWRGRLFVKEAKEKDASTFEFPPGCGSTFRFELRRVPIFARLGSRSQGHSIPIKSEFQRLLKHSGVELDEPHVLFADKTGNNFIWSKWRKFEAEEEILLVAGCD